MPREGTRELSRRRRRAGWLARFGVAIASGILVLGGCVGGTTPGGPTSGAGTPGAATPGATALAIPSGATPPGSTAPSGAPPDATAPRASQTAPGRGGTGTATPAPLPASAEPAPASLVITQADSGRTLQLAVGQQLLVDLGSTLEWVVTVADQGVVGRVPGVLVIRGAQGIYVARAAGSTLLSAIGSPPCASGACPQFRVAFSVTLVVR